MFSTKTSKMLAAAALLAGSQVPTQEEFIHPKIDVEEPLYTKTPELTELHKATTDSQIKEAYLKRDDFEEFDLEELALAELYFSTVPVMYLVLEEMIPLGDGKVLIIETGYPITLEDLVLLEMIEEALRLDAKHEEAANKEKEAALEKKNSEAKFEETCEKAHSEEL